MSDSFIGEIKPVGFGFAPRGWSTCEGQLLPISQNTALFSLLGTTYGGDGRTTFQLPDLSGRSMVGVGTGPGLATKRWGERGGSETNTLTIANMPSHNHALHSEFVTANEAGASGNMLAQTPGNPIYASPRARSNKTLAGESIQNTGNGQTVNNLSPYLSIYMCIALVGIYPSRN